MNAPTKPPKIVTFGCRLNSYESEIMRDHATNAELGNAIIFNTCAVTAEAERQARQAIRKARRNDPHARIIVTGCAAQINPQAYASMAEVDTVLGNEEKLSPKAWQAPEPSLSNAEKIKVGDIMSVRQTAGHLINNFTARARAFVQIQNGCDHRCTFCIIPFGRGNSRSVPMGSVIEQIRRLVDNGYREIVLTGVDITSFGADLPGTPGLGKLIQTILNEIPDLPRLRLSSIDSVEVDQALLECFTDPRMMPHLHLSLQSGDDMILKRMKRRHLRDNSIRFSQDVKKLRPDMTFGADLIAGFPTETEEMFKNTLALVDECDLTFLHVFPFSPRPDTPAARMPQVAGSIIKARAKRLRQKGEAALNKRAHSLDGTQADILVETEFSGRTPHFMPVKLDVKATPGELANVLLHCNESYQLQGRLAE